MVTYAEVVFAWLTLLVVLDFLRILSQSIFLARRVFSEIVQALTDPSFTYRAVFLHSKEQFAPLFTRY